MKYSDARIQEEKHYLARLKELAPLEECVRVVAGLHDPELHDQSVDADVKQLLQESAESRLQAYAIEIEKAVDAGEEFIQISWISGSDDPHIVPYELYIWLYNRCGVDSPKMHFAVIYHRLAFVSGPNAELQPSLVSLVRSVVESTCRDAFLAAAEALRDPIESHIAIRRADEWITPAEALDILLSDPILAELEYWVDGTVRRSRMSSRLSKMATQNPSRLISKGKYKSRRYLRSSIDAFRLYLRDQDLAQADE